MTVPEICFIILVIILGILGLWLAWGMDKFANDARDKSEQSDIKMKENIAFIRKKLEGEKK